MADGRDEVGAERVRQFVRMLDVERLDSDLFRAWNPPPPGEQRRTALFGGQVAAHCLRAAAATVTPEHRPHSLHGYFLRPGRDDAWTILRVERIRDGRSFTTRTVVAQQDGEAIFSLTASFHRDEEGDETSTSIAADAGDPDELIAANGPTENPWDVASPFERVEVPGFGFLSERPEPRRAFWTRLRGGLPDDPVLHAAVLTFISDMGVVGAVRAALGRRDDVGMGASLDHALWLHRPVRADGWLLFDVWGRANGGSRGLGVGTLHTGDGTHALTVAQEALVRFPREQ
ncbi:MAG TPA: acyl-CoA thioesterase domain-containing protein [Mycobacteriales bacterium]